MLQLKSLELQGFKSFPDKTVIEFSRGITAIVGPNGSGKSNISDALRWVMGETSSKTLRGSKMEDVIFDGTKERKALGYAQVTMCFDNSGRELDIDFAEVSIARRYYRSGESEYYINGAQVRLKDIQSLLRDTGLGKDGYSIIGQGAVTDIISAKSTDRRDVFEEAAGISGFKFRRDESARKLGLTNDNIIRLNDILSELATRLPVVEKQADKARKYLAYREEKKLLDIGIWLSEDIRITVESERLSGVIDTLNNDLSQVSVRMAYLADVTEGAEKRSAELTAEIESVRGDIKATEDGVKEHTGRIMVLENEIVHAESDIARLEKETEDAGRSAEELLKKREELTFQAQSITEEISSSDAKAKALSEQLSAGEKKENGFYSESSVLRDKLSLIIAAKSENDIRLASLMQQKADSEEKSVSLAADSADAEERLKTLISAKAGMQTALKETEDLIEQNANIVKGQTIKCELSKNKLIEITEACSSLKLELAKSENRFSLLRDMEQNHEGFTGSVHMVIKEASRGILSGITGTVAELLTVPGKYATAIETALGAAIQNIVTENEGDAKNAIFFLKSRNGGRATFLPLTSIKGRRLEVNGLDGEDGYLGIASELISYEPRYRDVAENLLGRTVVADTLDSASDIAKKYKFAFRIVTLDGQLVNAGGSMTGGSAAKSAEVFSRRSELEELTSKIADLKEKYQSRQKELIALQNEDTRLSALLDGMKNEISALEKRLIENKSSLAHNAEYTETVSAQQKTLADDAVKNTQLLAALATDIETVSAEKEKLLEQEALLNSERESLEAAHSDLKAERDALLEKLSECKLLRLEKENAYNGIQENIARLEENVSGLRSRTQEVETEKDSYRKLISDAEAEKVKLQTEIDTAADTAKAFASEIVKKTDERQKQEKKINDCRAEEKELYASKENTVREIEKVSAAKTAAEDKLSSMQARLWDEYEVTPSEARSGFSPSENLKEASDRAAELKGKLRALGEINVGSIEEYAELKNRFDTLSGQIKDLTDAKESLEELIRSLENDMRRIFEDKFKVIGKEFEKVFKELFNGGEARLSLSGSDDVLESGIEIFVAPPGKIIKNMSSLSGGEQSLTAIALYFALMKINPSPFCLLDEIESALDDVNVVRFAEYLYNLTDNTQIIAITHRRGTMEIADRLYGVTMREKGISRVITINVNEIEKDIN